MNRKHVLALVSTVLLVPMLAFATEKFMCMLPYSTAGSANTDMARTLQDAGIVFDGGTSGGLGCCYDGGYTLNCAWRAGANIAMQCGSDVRYTTCAANTGSSCTVTPNNSFMVDFTNNKDPKLMYLVPNDRVIAVQGVADGGYCTFGTTPYPKP
jgi:hypothetical protein